MKKTKTAEVSSKALYAIAITRISLGLVFLWAFFDKLFGLGFATCRDAKTGVVDVMCNRAWLEGGSPTAGFLKNAVQGPFENFYHNLAGKDLVDWLFMFALLSIGAALVLGVAVRLAALGGTLLLLMMWTALLWPANNPVLDDHILYALFLAVIATTNDSQKLGLGAWWRKQAIVRRLPILG